MKIAVAGAGHGGLTAAALLSKNGYDVTVYEARQKNELGHDWEDRFTFSLLEEITGQKIADDTWRYRGDCQFVSPSYNTKVVINYTEENRQKIMWRKPLIGMLLEFCEDNGVKFVFGNEVKSPLVENNRVVGIRTAAGDIRCDLVVDAAGVFSPVRSGLPRNFGIEKSPQRGEVFYAWRGYFNKTENVNPEVPFEVYLCHEREKGLSWCCVNPDSVDILIGRVDPIKQDSVDRHIAGFKSRHPYMGDEILHGGVWGVIPVRRPLALMVAPGYAAVGDAAFMTTPMNGMGIDLSLNAGKLLAETIISHHNCEITALWCYNRDFHRRWGGDTAKNEGLKNALITMPGEGVDFLFDNAVIQASDLSGAGRNTNLASLLGKFVRGMKQPKTFFAVLDGLMKGGRLASALKAAPMNYSKDAVERWMDLVLRADGKISN